MKIKNLAIEIVLTVLLLGAICSPFLSIYAIVKALFLSIESKIYVAEIGISALSFVVFFKSFESLRAYYHKSIKL